MPHPKYVHVPIPETCQCHFIWCKVRCMKRDFTDVIPLKILRWENCSGLPEWTNLIRTVLRREIQKPDIPWYRTVVLKVGPRAAVATAAPVTSYKCRFFSSVLNLPKGKLWAWKPGLTFNKPSRWFWYLLKFENHDLHQVLFSLIERAWG